MQTNLYFYRTSDSLKICLIQQDLSTKPKMGAALRKKYMNKKIKA